MSQIYVVCAPPKVFSIDGFIGAPLAAYSDYPSAFAYASSIFKTNPLFASFQNQISAKDLIFLITLQPTPSTPSVIPTPTVTVSK